MQRLLSFTAVQNILPSANIFSDALSAIAKYNNYTIGFPLSSIMLTVRIFFYASLLITHPLYYTFRLSGIPK